MVPAGTSWHLLTGVTPPTGSSLGGVTFSRQGINFENAATRAWTRDTGRIPATEANATCLPPTGLPRYGRSRLNGETNDDPDCLGAAEWSVPCLPAADGPRSGVGTGCHREAIASAADRAIRRHPRPAVRVGRRT